MEATTDRLVEAGQSAVQAAGALAAQYAFSVLGAIILLVVGYIVAGLAERWLFAGLKRVRGFDETLRIFLSKILRYAILILVGITVLAQFGVQTASIIAALGAIGLAIGLALQGTLQNIASGIMLLVLRPFRVGEYVAVGSLAGTVLEVGLFATELRTWDGLYVMAPNSQLWNSAVTNYSRNPRRLDECSVRISYEGDIGLALRTLSGLAEADKRVLKDPAPIAYVKELGESAILVVLRYWTASSDNWATKVALLKAAREAFAKAGISIALPQRNVHVIGTQAIGISEPAIDAPAAPAMDAPTTKVERRRGNR
ncbi:MAG: mechanosensitive ion channel family protein [Rhizobiaceae bacterium]|jgi:small conductance mechanosensitive channel